LILEVLFFVHFALEVTSYTPTEATSYTQTKTMDRENDVILQQLEEEIFTVEQIFTVLVFVDGMLVLLRIYPTIFLVKEIRNGIMTRETYPREEYLCC
jgi:hypothetical protein